MYQIDELLGDFRKRYFGDGHRRTVYDLIKCKNGDSHIWSGIGVVEQKGDWSLKSSQINRQHLSTIDGVILSSYALEHYLAEHTQIKVENLMLQSFDIKAGSEPVENVNKKFYTLS